MLINYAGREINAKIVYYGPGLSGKTTNLECIYASVPQGSRGKMVSMKTRQDRTLFFDFLPLELGEVQGFRTRFLLYTVPGQVFYNATRKLVLKGADAVVFVADSGRGKMDENLESLANLEENLREQGLSLDTLPWVIQYNKRDLPEVYGLDELQAELNPRGAPNFEAEAANGRGVYETLHAVSRLLFQRLKSELRPRPGQAAQAGVKPGVAAPVSKPEAPSPASGPVVGRSVRPGGPAPSALPTSRPQGSVAPPAVAVPRTPGAPGSDRTAPGRTATQVVDTVRKPAPRLDSVESGTGPSSGERSPDYGHVVDLALQADAPGASPARGPADGFIKDPRRRVGDAAPDPRSGAHPAPPSGPIRTQHVVVVVTPAELKQGTTIRLLVDLRLET